MASEKAAGAMSGAASGAAAGTAILPGWGTAIGAVIGGVAGYLGSKKVPTNIPKLDIGKLTEQARTHAETNLRNQIELERSLLPEQAKIRTGLDVSLGDRLAETSGPSFTRRLIEGAQQAGQNLPEGSVGRMAIEQAKLGGALSPEMQAQIVQSSLEGAGRSGILGSGAGRGLVARDIGLSSQALMQQRLAQGLGAEQQATSNYLQGFGMGEQLRQGNLGLLGQILQGRQMPEAGLSVSGLLDLELANAGIARQQAAAEAQKVRDSNAATQAMIGQAGTLAGGLYGASSKPATGTTTAPYDIYQNVGKNWKG